MYAIDSLKHALQSLNTECNPVEDGITDGTVELEKVLGSLEMTAENANTYLKNKQIEKKQLCT